MTKGLAHASQDRGIITATETLDGSGARAMGLGGSGQPNSAVERPLARDGRRSFPRLLWRAGIVVSGSAAAALVAGFVAFASAVPTEEIELSRSADGIVVLTGGALRIRDAIELLAAGRGQRLLITGVNPATNSHGLSQLVPVYKRLFDCCIDLDHSAINTVGNALAAREWSKRRNFRSLIVVTSNYHLPRAMAELAHQLPDVGLVPFPVVPQRSRQEPWWTDAARTRLMASEYVKYIYAILRNGLDLTATAGLARDRGPAES